jgi:hypothetical protein
LKNTKAPDVASAASILNPQLPELKPVAVISPGLVAIAREVEVKVSDPNLL